MHNLAAPIEDKFHKYPVLRIPTGNGNDQLIIGLDKARAVLIWHDYIRRFVERNDPAFFGLKGSGRVSGTPESP
ncbi:MAG: hypothetical protein A4E66_00675 [Syntrophus sp. PtaB.Bin001]|nr:MAG: hypothetical protein A4E66_00675 [Syntrophus sp. PtaB.Bin001]